MTSDLPAPGSDVIPEPAPTAAPCCSAEKQSGCCDASDKPTCCGAEATKGGGCACR